MTEKIISLPDRHGPPAPVQAPPSFEPEQSVLGAILVRPEVLPQIEGTLTPGDFYREAHGRIFQAMLDLYAKNEPVDLVTVCALLRNRGQIEGVGGDGFLAGLSEQVGFATNAGYYAHLVRTYAWRREYRSTLLQLDSLEKNPAARSDDLMTLLGSKLVELEATYPGNYAEKTRLISLEELLTTKFPEKSELIGGGVWPAGTGLMIAGESGAGKSLMLNQLALSLATGSDFMGLEVPTARRVLVFQGENTLRQEQERYLAQIKGMGITSAPSNVAYFPMVERLELVNHHHRKIMVNAIRTHQADAFFVDPVISFHSENENDNGAMRRVLDCITEIMRRTGAGAGVLHHFGKPTENGTVEHRARGASAIRDWCDTMLALTVKKVQAGYQHQITFSKIRNGRQPKSIILERDENLVFRVTEEQSKCTPEQVAQVIRAKGGRVNSRKDLIAFIRETVECGERTARKFIQTAIDRQAIMAVIGDRDPQKAGATPNAYIVVDQD